MYNRGSYTEELVNKTIKWYLVNEIAFFRKAHVPISINNKFCNKNFSGRLTAKADVDYYGVCDGRYISFEVKETEKDFFNLIQIKEHQLSTLLKIHDFNATAFIILNFVNMNDSIWIIPIIKIQELVKNGIKKIQFKDIAKYGIHLPLEYPGVLDWLKVLKISTKKID